MKDFIITFYDCKEVMRGSARLFAKNRREAERKCLDLYPNAVGMEVFIRMEDI